MKYHSWQFDIFWHFNNFILSFIDWRWQFCGKFPGFRCCQKHHFEPEFLEQTRRRPRPKWPWVRPVNFGRPFQQVRSTNSLLFPETQFHFNLILFAGCLWTLRQLRGPLQRATSPRWSPCPRASTTCEWEEAEGHTTLGPYPLGGNINRRTTHCNQTILV